MSNGFGPLIDHPIPVRTGEMWVSTVWTSARPGSS